MPSGSADFYYLKAMDYLSINGESGVESDGDSTDCVKCRAEVRSMTFLIYNNLSTVNVSSFGGVPNFGGSNKMRFISILAFIF